MHLNEAIRYVNSLSQEQIDTELSGILLDHEHYNGLKKRVEDFTMSICNSQRMFSMFIGMPQERYAEPRAEDFRKIDLIGYLHHNGMKHEKRYDYN